MGREAQLDKGLMGFIGEKFHSRDLDCMGNMEDHCALPVGMVVTQEEKEKEAKTYSHEVAQNGCGETELVGSASVPGSVAKQVMPLTNTSRGTWSVTTPTDLLLV